MLERTRPESDRATYHHGNLRAALIDAGLVLTRAGGGDALSLRDVTRRVGVSPNAAYRHFADRDALLAAIAERIQRGMADRMRDVEASGSASPRDALRAVGLGYIGFARREPGWFEVAFATTEALPGASVIPAPLAMLVSALDGLVESGELDASKRAGAEWPCWSAVHGFALLALNGPLRALPEAEISAAAERTVDAIITGLLDRREPARTSDIATASELATP